MVSRYYIYICYIDGNEDEEVKTESILGHFELLTSPFRVRRLGCIHAKTIPDSAFLEQCGELSHLSQVHDRL